MKCNKLQIYNNISVTAQNSLSKLLRNTSVSQ